MYNKTSMTRTLIAHLLANSPVPGQIKYRKFTNKYLGIFLETFYHFMTKMYGACIH